VPVVQAVLLADDDNVPQLPRNVYDGAVDHYPVVSAASIAHLGAQQHLE